MYKASLVPVGKDQAAHLELSREIVRAFNNRYGATFPEMQAVFTEAPTVIGTDGARKMSKSVGNTIDILAEPDVIRKQVMSMVTDTERILRRNRAGPRSATSASSTASSAKTSSRSGTANEPLEPAAWTRSASSPIGSRSSTRPRGSGTSSSSRRRQGR